MAYFGDQQFTVRIDELKSGEIRYLCWHKSNSILAKPSLMLCRGTVKRGGNGEIREFTFLHDDRVFTIEYIPSKLKGGVNYYFIEVTDSNHKKSTWKMEQRPIPKYLRNLS
ncbi:MAG: hypothetical protein VX772_02390 [Bacteroidota bacterium]|uniref:PD(D/E)XK endonuclease domain-containing protein n=1 Tax=Flagellimonas okinawensis TaxID=3031324 RepID=A0ABT5XIN7_9FLAO|nr:hypothetical protein [[Muricauda] okinawensis]MDF0705748.1 hypothetical protein [[Muricauda] okinawensis]MEC8831182.1 hypothetical protein [Bacteroidota bacterium]